MTNAISGSGGILSLGSSAVAEWTQATLRIDGRMIDVTSIDSASFKEFIAGKRGGQIDVEGNFYPGDAEQALFITAALAGTKLTGATQPKLTKSTGAHNISGDAYVENYRWGVPHDDKQTFSCTLRFTGTIAYSAT